MKNVNYLIEEYMLNKQIKKINPILLGKCRESVYTKVFLKIGLPITGQILFGVITEIPIQI